MTTVLRLPLGGDDGVFNAEAGPSKFASPAVDPASTLDEVVRAIRGSKRMVVICGVSTAAAIPDFRGAAGLFSSNPSRKGKEPMKDLFHIKALASPTLLAAHHALITELASLSLSAAPTSFHTYLAHLDAERQLLRVYTQNIDGLEEKAGMRAGLPPKPHLKGKAKAAPIPANSAPTTPRVIPLHGSLSTLSCSLCHHKTPLAPHLPLPSTTVPCPTCALSSSIRHALSERSRRSGTLRADVVLYGEEHPQGDLIGAAVERDMKGTGGQLKEGKLDFLLVAGTTLAIPGVKRIVKEMARVLHAQRGSKAAVPRTVFINDEPPRNVGEWAGVFDLWIQGDIQEVVQIIQGHELRTPAKEKPPRTPKKRRNPAPPTPDSLGRPVPDAQITTPTKKRKTIPPTPESVPKATSSFGSTRVSSSGTDWLLTPRATPPSPRKGAKLDADQTPTKKPRWGDSSSFSPLSDLDEEI